MFLGKVIGTVWSTKKTPDLEGVRFLVVHPFDMDKEPTKNVVVVADRLGAGPGETVMCAYGKAARSAIGNWQSKMSYFRPLSPLSARAASRSSSDCVSARSTRSTIATTAASIDMS